MQVTDWDAVQTSAFNALDGALRSEAGQVSRTFSRIQKILTAWDGGIADLVAKLDDGAAIPNTTGLAGAMPLTKERLIGMMEDFRQASTAFNSPEHQVAYVALAGLSATL